MKKLLMGFALCLTATGALCADSVEVFHGAVKVGLDARKRVYVVIARHDHPEDRQCITLFALAQPAIPIDFDARDYPDVVVEFGRVGGNYRLLVKDGNAAVLVRLAPNDSRASSKLTATLVELTGQFSFKLQQNPGSECVGSFAEPDLRAVPLEVGGER